MNAKRACALLVLAASLTFAFFPTAAVALSDRENATDAEGISIAEESTEALPDFPVLDFSTQNGPGPQEVEFDVAPGKYRGQNGELIEVAAKSSYTCKLTVDAPHWSNGAQSVIAKPRVQCKGASGQIPIRVDATLARTSVNDYRKVKIIASSSYIQIVTSGVASYGAKQTWYVPKLGTQKVKGGYYFRASGIANPSAPFAPFNIGGAVSRFLWVH